MDEFYGVKEHREGENPRFIHWRRSARTGTLVAKEMTQVSPPRLLILVDTYLPIARSRATSRSRSDRDGRLAGEHALEQGSPWPVRVVGRLGRREPHARQAHRRDVLAVLAQLELNTQPRYADLLDHAFELIKSGTTPC
jgi:uncharacterized protein (DUF58 family)